MKNLKENSLALCGIGLVVDMRKSIDADELLAASANPLTRMSICLIHGEWIRASNSLTRFRCLAVIILVLTSSVFDSNAQSLSETSPELIRTADQRVEFKESAEQAKDGRNVAYHDSKRWPGIFIRVVLFPAALIMGALWKYRRNLRLDLHSDEILLKSELVSMQGEKKLDGRLFLTNQRVVFKADDRSVTIDVTLSSIEGTSIRRAKLLGIPTAGKVISIQTDSGKSLDVIPRIADDWAEAIEKQLLVDANQ